MKLKNFLLLIVLIVSLGKVYAQSPTGLDTEFAAYMIETERRTVFVQNMNLTEQEAPLFWDLYDQYESELLLIREDAINNLKKYTASYANLTEEQANEIMLAELKNRAKRVSAQKKYYKKMSSELNSKIAARFIQLDEIATMVLKLSIYDEIPLVGGN
jgi:hypothetical protein